jgi:CelD/BcsL family acetyltransferase involved in cellulose biosynthesis
MARSTPDKASFLEQPGHVDFFQAIGPVTYQNGNLELIFLAVEGQPVAAMWQFVYRDRVLLYNSGLDAGQYGALSPGIVLLTYSVEHAIQEDYKVYDFLQGDETYKLRMGGQPTSVHNLIIRRKE